MEWSGERGLERLPEGPGMLVMGVEGGARGSAVVGVCGGEKLGEEECDEEDSASSSQEATGEGGSSLGFGFLDFFGLNEELRDNFWSEDSSPR